MGTGTRIRSATWEHTFLCMCAAGAVSNLRPFKVLRRHRGKGRRRDKGNERAACSPFFLGIPLPSLVTLVVFVPLGPNVVYACRLEGSLPDDGHRRHAAAPKGPHEASRCASVDTQFQLPGSRSPGEPAGLARARKGSSALYCAGGRGKASRCFSCRTAWAGNQRRGCPAGALLLVVRLPSFLLSFQPFLSNQMAEQVRTSSSSAYHKRTKKERIAAASAGSPPPGSGPAASSLPQEGTPPPSCDQFLTPSQPRRTRNAIRLFSRIPRKRHRRWTRRKACSARSWPPSIARSKLSSLRWARSPLERPSSMLFESVSTRFSVRNPCLQACLPSSFSSDGHAARSRVKQEGPDLLARLARQGRRQAGL